MGLRKLEKKIETVVFENEVNAREYLKKLVQTKKENAYFFVCTLFGNDTGWNQKSFHVNEYEEALLYIKEHKHKRVFLPTVLFSSRNRAENAINEMKFILLDLDLYKSVHKNLNAEQAFEKIQKEYFETNKLPYSNGYADSGAGLYLIYSLEPVSGYENIKKRNDIIERLSYTLDEFYPDEKSLDAPHVFGVPTTINHKYSSKPVIKAFFSELPDYTIDELDQSIPTMWDTFLDQGRFETLKKPKEKKTVTPEQKEAAEKKRKAAEEQKKKVGKKQHQKIISVPIIKERTYSYDMIQNMFKLAEIRLYDCEGFREIMLFVIRNYYHGMHAKRFHAGDVSLFDESYSLAKQLNDQFIKPIDEDELRLSTLNTKKVYRISLEKLNRWLRITIDEQAQLKVKTKKAKNHKSKLQMRELRGSQGSIEEYNQKRADDKEHLLDMLRRHLKKNPKAKGKELAELLGVSPGWISRLKKEL